MFLIYLLLLLFYGALQEDEEAETALEVSEQEVLQGALQKQFFGRAKLLSNAVGKVEQVQNKGGMLVIEGGPGEGKTVFMVNLSLQLLLNIDGI